MGLKIRQTKEQILNRYLKEEENMSQNQHDLSNMQYQERFMNLIMPGFNPISESSLNFGKSEKAGMSFDVDLEEDGADYKSAI